MSGFRSVTWTGLERDVTLTSGQSGRRPDSVNVTRIGEGESVGDILSQSFLSLFL